jgi:hypothetical protein
MKAAPLIFIMISCIVSAKALSLLFVPGKRYIYRVLAAAGASAFACSNVLRAFTGGKGGKAYNITNVLVYYAGQALIALSVMI